MALAPACRCSLALAGFNGRPYIAQHAWQTNAAGYRFHNWYGIGALALDEAVTIATTHVPGSLGAFSQSPWFPASDEMGLSLAIPDGDGAGVSDTLSVAGLPQRRAQRRLADSGCRPGARRYRYCDVLAPPLPLR